MEPPFSRISASTVVATTRVDRKCSCQYFPVHNRAHPPRSTSATSMATPHVAGAAAAHLAGHPSATPARVASALTAGAVTGKASGPGTGSPNRLLQIVP
ncbi:S8 family serine peptidase [Streptomyces scabiei]|uniref:S8 family serine peptidase n=1 Tax=Streptomyces scabiei TaxID=1930 RepID=UPI0039F6BB52